MDEVRKPINSVNSLQFSEKINVYWILPVHPIAIPDDIFLPLPISRKEIRTWNLQFNNSGGSDSTTGVPMSVLTAAVPTASICVGTFPVKSWH
jgi:hypothetical protein